MRRRRITSLACAAVAALTIGAASASADPSSNPNLLTFVVVCPGMASFDATVVGPIGFVEGQRLIAVRQATATQGSLDLVECTATNPQIGSQTVFLQFVQRDKRPRREVVWGLLARDSHTIPLLSVGAPAVSPSARQFSSRSIVTRPEAAVLSRPAIDTLLAGVGC